MRLDEISTKKLADYKTAAGKDASAADKAGDFERGNKRFRGIIKATKKQFDNDAKERKQVNEAPKGTLHKVRFKYDDPSGKGIASGSIKVYAPDRDRAISYALADLQKYKLNNIVIASVTNLNQN